MKLSFQDRKFMRSNEPHRGRADIEILMNQTVSQTDDTTPIHRWGPIAHVSRQGVGSLTDDLKIPQNSINRPRISPKGFKIKALKIHAYLSDGRKHILHEQQPFTP